MSFLLQLAALFNMLAALYPGLAAEFHYLATQALGLIH